MRLKTLLCAFLSLMLLPCAALADALDMGLLTYERSDAQGESIALVDDASDAASSFIQPLDLWMDASPNMGGVNTINGSIYSSEGEELFTGGFHYVRAATRQLGAQQGWYVNLLQSLPEIFGYQRTSLRVFRYDDGLYPDALLSGAGLINESTSAEAKASLQRDLHLWSANADAATFLDMVSDTPRTFYGTGAAGAARLASAEKLENEEVRSQLASVQNAALSVQRGEALAADSENYLCNREGGQSHLLTALENLDRSRLTLITLDTWSLGALQTTTEEGMVSQVQKLLDDTGLFKGTELCATVYALRMDYIGSITSYSWQKPAEALHWGRFLRGSDDVYRECAMPRPMLVLAIGAQEQVDALCSQLEALFASSLFAGERGFQDGDGMVVAVNYFYQNEKKERTSFSFKWARGDVRPAKVEAVTLEQELAFAATLDGGSADVTAPVKLSQEADGSYADHVLEVRVALSDSAAQLGIAPQAASEGAELTLLDSLVLREELPNTAENRAALAAEGVQYIPMRETLYVFRPLSELHDAALSADYDAAANQVVFRLTLDGGTLSPGWRTYRIALTVGGSGVSVPAMFPWLTANDAAGDALSGKWDVAFASRLPEEWLTLPAKIAASGGESRRELVSGLRHAWCVADQSTTLGMTPNVPPVFRLLHAGELTRQLQAASVNAAYTLTSFDVTLQIDGATR